jgi:hypothetical protein
MKPFLKQLQAAAKHLENNSKNNRIGIIAATGEVWDDIRGIERYNAGNVVLDKLNRMGRFKWTR